MKKKNDMGSINEKWKAFDSRIFQNIPTQIKNNNKRKTNE